MKAARGPRDDAEDRRSAQGERLRWDLWLHREVNCCNNNIST